MITFYSELIGFRTLAGIWSDIIEKGLSDILTNAVQLSLLRVIQRGLLLERVIVLSILGFVSSLILIILTTPG